MRESEDVRTATQIPEVKYAKIHFSDTEKK